MKPTSIIFGIKSFVRRKQKNFFGILAIALGVSLITGITVTDQSLTTGFGIFFTYGLGEVDGTVTYSNIFMNETSANFIGSDLLQLKNVTAFTTELSMSVISSTDQGLISTQSKLTGINRTDNSTLFGNLININNTKVNIASLGQNEVFIGKQLAGDLRIGVGDPFNYSLSMNGYHIQKSLIVKDIISNTERGAMSGNRAIFIDLTTMQNEFNLAFSLLHLPIANPVNVIFLKFSTIIQSVDDGKLVISQMKDLLKKSPQVTALGGINDFTISTDRITIKDLGKTLADALGNLLSIFGSILIIAGLILIVNIQLMTVENREKQIGIQRAVGTKTHQIILSNLTEFIINGLVGGLVGIIGGIFFGWILILAFGVAFGFDGSLIPLSVPSSILVSAFVMGFVISVLSGLYPSIKASRINVIEVLRGLESKNYKVNQGSGFWGFVFGLILTVLGLLQVSSLSKYPFDYPNAYVNVSDAEAIYISTTFLLVGILVLLSYFVSRKTILTVAGLSLLAYPMFQLFFVFNQIKAGNGGVNYILVMTISLIGGSILLVSLNLDSIASISELIFSKFFSAISMISFKQMSSQKTRSTLTFAIFAFILTLNIFLASWSYSDRFGAEHQDDIISGGSDILIIASQPVPSNISTQYTQGLENKFSSITNAAAFPNTNYGMLYLNNNGTIINSKNATNTFPVNMFAINNNSLYKNGKLMYNFVLNPAKLNTTDFSFPSQYSKGLELDNKTEPLDLYLSSNTQENANAWNFFSSGMMVTNKTSGQQLPVIITSSIAKLNIASQQIQYLKGIGDAVWLPLTNGSFQEFVIMAISDNNPLFDSYILSQSVGYPSLANGAFVQEEWANKLAAFNPNTESYLNQTNYFLLSTINPVKSDANEKLSGDIEAWSNGIQTGTFRTNEGILYGFISTSVYSLYSTLFDGQFRVFQFMQYFTTLGFLFGVISLLVVSVRAVQERKREIGMMRSIGVKRHEIVISLILELSVMGVIGLLIGLINGNLLAYGLVTINSGGLTTFLIPWDTIAIYTAITLGSALFASIIPGRIASLIPPSDALRYVG